jgi:hypothetical protein
MDEVIASPLIENTAKKCKLSDAHTSPDPLQVLPKILTGSRLDMSMRDGNTTVIIPPINASEKRSKEGVNYKQPLPINEIPITNNLCLLISKGQKILYFPSMFSNFTSWRSVLEDLLN